VISAISATDEIGNLLRAIRLARPDGQLYANQKDKFQEAMKMVEQIAITVRKISRKKELTLLDCACGKGYITFMADYVLKSKLNRTAHFIGVDRNPGLIRKCIEAQRVLGYQNMEFYASDIIEFDPDKRPDITCCLHACDTATDEAIAKGVTLDSRFIIVVPCCQREIHRQMQRHPLTPVTQFPLFKERLSSIFTDAVRALVLRAAGYKVEVFEFIASSVTPKNTMLRAEKIWTEDKEALRQYWQLRKTFNIEPKIEEYLTWLQPA